MSKGKLKSYNNSHHHHRNMQRHQQQQQQRSFFLPIMLCSRSTINDVVKFSNHQSPSPTATATGVGCHPKKRNSSKVAGFPTTTPPHINLPPHYYTSFSSAVKSLNDNNHRRHHPPPHYHKSTKPHLPSLPHIPAVPFSSTEKPENSSNGYDDHHRSASLDVVRSSGRDRSNNNTDSSSSSSGDAGGKLDGCRTRGGGDGRGSGGSGRRCRRDLKPIDDVGSLDPPLPVVKKSAATAGMVGAEEDRTRDSLWKRRSGGTAPALRRLEIRPHPLPLPSVSRSGGGRGAVVKTV